MKILVAVPTAETIMPEVFKAIYGLDKCGHWVVFDYIRGYDCAQARNRIAEEAIREEADYVLMVDSDTVIPSDTLRLMLENPVDVCLGVYANRNGNNVYTKATCVCRKYMLSGEEYYNYPTESEYSSDEISQMESEGNSKIVIHGGGFGCALVKTEVFKTLSWPWFKWVDYEDRHGTLSEDLYFCEKCKNAGIPVYSDIRVKCGHIFRYVQEVL